MSQVNKLNAGSKIASIASDSIQKVAPIVSEAFINNAEREFKQEKAERAKKLNAGSKIASIASDSIQKAAPIVSEAFIGNSEREFNQKKTEKK